MGSGQVESEGDAPSLLSSLASVEGAREKLFLELVGKRSTGSSEPRAPWRASRAVRRRLFRGMRRGLGPKDRSGDGGEHCSSGDGTSSCVVQMRRRL